MLTLSDAWGKEFYANQMVPNDLTLMMVACMANITGARSITEGALINKSARIAISMQAFYDTVMFMQRDYGRNPEHILVILGANGVPMSAVIKNKEGDLVFDPLENLRASRTQDFYLYRCPTTVNGVYDSMSCVELASMSYLDAVKELRVRKLWVDNAWGYDRDLSRGSNYL